MYPLRCFYKVSFINRYNLLRSTNNTGNRLDFVETITFMGGRLSYLTHTV